MNALFPWSMLGCTILVVALARLTLHPASDPFEAAGFALLTSIALLGLLEHSMLMLPVPADALWRLGLKSHRRAARTAGGATP